MPAQTATPTQIGRFRILRLLGTGAQSSVYLAHDPQLEREVAIKTLHFSRSDALQNQALINEARTVGKLRHVNIVPIFDAGEQDGDPYLVFEYVAGDTLAQKIRKEGAMPAAQAAELTLGVLDALIGAHQAQIVHRDLKPSNILIDADGRARVMDFGIAARISAPKDSDAELVGTPAYMTPEYVSDRIIGPQTDVYAAGLVLYEMVCGRRAVQADDLPQLLRKVASETIAFPAELRQRIDEKLLDIIAKATARDPQLRYSSAAQMREALAAWMRPEAATAEESAGGSNTTVEFLLRRMRHKSDFPAMSAAISTINRIASSEKDNVATLSNAILRDFALTNKILRLVNSAYYRSVTGGSVSTVSRAIVVLGFNTVRDLAVSLILFEHLQNKDQAERLRDHFLLANMSSIFARKVASTYMPAEGEEAFICALFHNLGRMLCRYYFPEEADAIARLQVSEQCSEVQAATRVLGVSFPELGMGIAESWSFPESIVRSMRPLADGKVPKTNSREERLRTLAAFSNEVSAAMERHSGDERAGALASIRARFADGVPVGSKNFQEALESSVRGVTELAGIMRINLRQTRFGRNLTAAAAPAADRGGNGVGGDSLVPGTLAEADAGAALSQPADKTLVIGGGAAGSLANSVAGAGNGSATGMDPLGLADSAATAATSDPQAVLAAGIQDISRALVDEFSLGDLLRIVLETMYRAIGFRCVLLCMRDGRSGTMNARFGFGVDVDQTIPRFRFRLGGADDIFNVILSKGVDVLISDATAEKIAPRIPEWFRRDIAAETFIVFPLRVNNVTVAMIYADRERAGSIVIAEGDLALLRTLRNQAVLAIKQSR
jgi:serine/threonine protein kinase